MVVAAAQEIIRRHGAVRTLVYSAGTNVPNRFWSNGAPEDYERVLDVNLDRCRAGRSRGAAGDAFRP